MFSCEALDSTSLSHELSSKSAFSLTARISFSCFESVGLAAGQIASALNLSMLLADGTMSALNSSSNTSLG